MGVPGFFLWLYNNYSKYKNFILNTTPDNIKSIYNFYNLPKKFASTTSIYNGTSYPDCVETTLLQFIKSLFWDPNDHIYKVNNYNFTEEPIVITPQANLIKLLLKINIDNEDSTNIKNEFSEIISNQPDLINIKIYKRPDNYEILSSYDNFIQVLSYLFNTDEIKLHEKTILDGLNEKLEKCNPDECDKIKLEIIDIKNQFNLDIENKIKVFFKVKGTVKYINDINFNKIDKNISIKYNCTECTGGIIFNIHEGHSYVDYDGSAYKTLKKNNYINIILILSDNSNAMIRQKFMIDKDLNICSYFIKKFKKIDTIPYYIKYMLTDKHLYFQNIDYQLEFDDGSIGGSIIEQYEYMNKILLLNDNDLGNLIIKSRFFFFFCKNRLRVTKLKKDTIDLIISEIKNLYKIFTRTNNIKIQTDENIDILKDVPCFKIINKVEYYDERADIDITSDDTISIGFYKIIEYLYSQKYILEPIYDVIKQYFRKDRFYNIKSK